MVPMISVTRLSKSYAIARDRDGGLTSLVAGVRRRNHRAAARRWALRDVDLEVQEGTFLGLIGTNGSGKSTLLRLIGGIGQPDEGEVSVRGSLAGLLDLSTGLQPDLTGRENAITAAMVAGATEGQARSSLTTVAAFAEIEEQLDEPVRTYSSGMKMRLALSVAIHTGARVLLIDEYLSVGDLAFREKCWQRLDELKQAGHTVVLATHDLSAIGRLCDEVLWLDQGRVRGHGEASAIALEYQRSVTAKPTAARQTRPSAATAAFDTQRVVIRDVELTPQVLAPGDTLEVVMRYERLDPDLETAVTSVRITDEAGRVYFAANSSRCREAHQLSDAALVRLHVTRLDLAPGAYFVDVGLHRADFEVAFDYHRRCHPLLISAPHTGKGVLQPPHEWSAAPSGLKPRADPTSGVERKTRLPEHQR